MSRKRCKGFTVYSPETFYPVSYNLRHYLFDEAYLEDVKKMANKSLALHFSNSLTSDVNVNKRSNIPYIYYARKYCPKTLLATEGSF